ncbi:hypothetical protein D9Q98_010272 [Chlorella vulgaris]|uniref:Uncharacterized protein n=1 Tax=Chlorella vulgaris TaxID=3077 RepID=A0A9D4YUZ8_CHLVU|nr:hypothetical protein D9Q98_010272 [Chlorella vulgaris]
MNDHRNALQPSESLEVDRQEDEASSQVETAARDASTPLAEASDRATEPEAADIEQPPAAAVTEADSQQGEPQQGRKEQQAAASRPATATDTPSQDPACPADESSSAAALESTATELPPTGPAAAKEAPASDPTTTSGAASTNGDTGGGSAISSAAAAASASAALEPGAAAQGKAAARPAIVSKPAKQRLTFSASPKCLEGMPRIAARTDYSHSRVRVRQILQDNLVLVKRLGEIARKPPAHEKGQAQLDRFRVNVATSSAARRRTAAKEVMGQNMRIYRRLQEVKPSKAVARQQHDKDFAAHKRMLAALALGRRGASGSCVAA